MFLSVRYHFAIQPIHPGLDSKPYANARGHSVLTHTHTADGLFTWTTKVVHNKGTVCCFCLDSLHRVLAQDVFAAEPQPPFPASVKDGYAVIGNVLSIVLMDILL